MTTVRLSAEIEQKLYDASQEQQRTKSDIIKEALEIYLVRGYPGNDSYTLGADVFGKYGSESENLSADYKRLLKEKLHAKYDTD